MDSAAQTMSMFLSVGSYSLTSNYPHLFIFNFTKFNISFPIQSVCYWQVLLQGHRVATGHSRDGCLQSGSIQFWSICCGQLGLDTRSCFLVGETYALWSLSIHKLLCNTIFYKSCSFLQNSNKGDYLYILYFLSFLYTTRISQYLSIKLGEGQVS